MEKLNFFTSTIYVKEKKEWLDHLNNSCDKYIDQDYIKNNFGVSSHSINLSHDVNFKEFIFFICKTGIDILKEQGYNTDIYSLIVSELWVQEFSKKGGGNHNSHMHSNNHISGFYFLKCSEKTSFPVFHDPRYVKKALQLIEKNNEDITSASEKISIKVNPGDFVFFNSYMDHEFVVDKGEEPFRFIHFNLQAIPKQLINNDIKRISS
jgi:uncharacterized protein (TIGR02466 family)